MSVIGYVADSLVTTGWAILAAITHSGAFVSVSSYRFDIVCLYTCVHCEDH
jgi:hypothetical protein